MRFHGSDVHGLKNLEDRVNGGIIKIPAMACAPGCGNTGGRANQANMIPLGHAHGAARIGNGDFYAKMRKGLHKGAHGRAATMIHHSPGPIQDHGLDFLCHEFASISASTSSAMPKPVLAPVPEVTETRRTPGIGVSKKASSGPEG